jgi:hypothetical protein
VKARVQERKLIAEMTTQEIVDELRRLQDDISRIVGRT